MFFLNSMYSNSAPLTIRLYTATETITQLLISPEDDPSPKLIYTYRDERIEERGTKILIENEKVAEATGEAP